LSPSRRASPRPSNLASKNGKIGSISPAWKYDDKIIWKDYVQPVEFDVAVTASEKSSVGGKGGIKILSVGQVGAEGSTGVERSTVSRVKFSIPILPPVRETEHSAT
jgi:hypothetical protein